MTRINNRKCGTCNGKLTARYVWSITAPVNWKGVGSVQMKCICGGLLNVEESVIELFHPCCSCEGKGVELSCSQCLSVGNAVVRERNDYWESFRDPHRSELPISDVAGTRIS